MIKFALEFQELEINSAFPLVVEIEAGVTHYHMIEIWRQESIIHWIFLTKYFINKFYFSIEIKESAWF